MGQYQLLRNHENDDDVAAFRRLARFHRRNARDANRHGNDLDLMMAPFGNVRAAVIREARYERVTVHGNTLRYIALFISCVLYPLVL